MHVLMNRKRAPERRAPSSSRNVPTTSLSNVAPGWTVGSWAGTAAAGVVEGVLAGDRRGGVSGGVGLRGPAATGARIANVALLERAEVRVAGELIEVGDVARDEVVDRQDRVAAGEQLADDPATDEAGGAGDEDPHRL